MFLVGTGNKYLNKQKNDIDLMDNNRRPYMQRSVSCDAAASFVRKRTKSTQVENVYFKEYSEMLCRAENEDSPCETVYSKFCSDFEDIKNQVLQVLAKIGTENSTNIPNSLDKTNTLLKVKLYAKDIKSKIEKIENEIQTAMTNSCTLILREDAFSPLHGRLQHKTYTASNKEHNYDKETMETLGDLLRLRVFPDNSITTGFPFSLNSYFESFSNESSISTNEAMSHELMRVSSLSNFPRSVDISLIKMAKAGFYQTGQGNETKCFSCGKSYNNWKSGDDPMTIHRRLSPSCPLVNTTDSNPSENHSTGYTDQRQTASDQQNSHFVNRSDSNITERTRTNDQNLTQSQLVTNNGNRNQNITTLSRQSSAASENRDCTETTSPSCSHTRNAESQTSGNNPNQAVGSSPSSSSSSCQHTHDYSSLGINIEKPKYANYAPLQVRISTFQGWPAYLDQTPQQMAMAGFLFTGYNDYTRCFYCGGGLRNWEAGDDPWVEHARWFSKCAFLKQNKGEKFINAVLKNQQEMENATNETTNNGQTMQSEAGATAERHVTSNQDHYLLQSVAARSVLEMGYTKEQVSAALSTIKTRNPGVSDISATDIMTILLGDDVQGAEAETSSSTASNMDRKQSEDATASAIDDTESLLEENRQLRDQRLCKVCLDLDATVAFLPCGHIVCCKDCAPAMRKCPVCRIYIKGTVKTYLA